MRTLQANEITATIRSLFLNLSTCAGKDLTDALDKALIHEQSPAGRDVLGQIIENYAIAREEQVAICQDTGMAVVFARVGQDLHIQGDFEAAVQEGVRQAYADGYLRKSVVKDPLFDRSNTGDNTPAVIHVRLVPGDRLHLTAIAKGFGSENMSALNMLVPADGVEGVRRFVLQTVEKAGPNPCPPLILGIGVGGTFEQAALMAKKATALPLDHHNPDPQYRQLEEDLLRDVNALGVGPGGVGGRITALKVHIFHAPTHIAGLPVALNICCHAARHAETTL
ncbi:MAG: fumarate hydratase [Clostridiales bacterium]|nr:fumarate hydratase [Clostridiales bacterium]